MKFFLQSLLLVILTIAFIGGTFYLKGKEGLKIYLPSSLNTVNANAQDNTPSRITFGTILQKTQENLEK